MKNLKTIAAALLIVFSASAFAADENSDRTTQISNVVKTYVDALSYGKVKELNSILDPEVKLTVSRGNTVQNYSRSEMIAELRTHENIEQNCQSSFTVIESNPAQAIVKVTMKYDSFSKVNLVTLNNSAKGWKITNVSSSFN